MWPPVSVDRDETAAGIVAVTLAIGPAVSRFIALYARVPESIESALVEGSRSTGVSRTVGVDRVPVPGYHSAVDGGAYDGAEIRCGVVLINGYGSR